MKPKPIFLDESLQKHLDEKGFAVTPFLDKEDVEQLRNFFNESNPNLPKKGIISSTFSGDMDFKMKINDYILNIYKDKYPKVFQNYKGLGGTFLFKVPSAESEMFMHQDWTIVDENQYYALNVWVPLVDITEENGPLMVLPGSHFKNYPTLRSPTLPFFFSGHESFLKNKMKPVYVKAGEAIVLQHSLVHYSPPNLTDEVRVAIVAGVVSENAPLKFYYYNKEEAPSIIEEFEQEDDFLLKFDNFHQGIRERPNMGKYAGKVPFNVPSLGGFKIRRLVNKMVKGARY